MNGWLWFTVALVGLGAVGLVCACVAQGRATTPAPTHPCPQCGGIGEVPIRGYGPEEWAECSRCDGTGVVAA